MENGYVRIANELYDVLLAMPLSAREVKVTWAVIRLTYGWNRKEVELNQKQISHLTGIDRPNVSRTLHSLRDRNILTIRDDGPKQFVGVNKRYRGWRVGESTLNIERDFLREIEKAGMPEIQSNLDPVDWVRLATWVGTVGMKPFLEAVEEGHAEGKHSLSYYMAEVYGASKFERVYLREMERLWELEKNSGRPSSQHPEQRNSSEGLTPLRSFLGEILSRGSSSE